MLTSIFLLTLLFHTTFGLSPRFLAHTVVEQRKSIPHGWNKRSLDGRSALNKKFITLPMRINLRQRNLHRAEELLLDVSSPDSKNYGNHYTPNQVVDLFAPAENSVAAVLGWLMDAGFKGVYSKAKGAVMVNVTVTAAEDLLHTEYNIYDHETGRPHVACSSYSVPRVVREHVDFITPTLHFDAILGKRGRTVPNGVVKSVGAPGDILGPVHLQTDGLIDTASEGLSDCDTKMTPACLKALYEFTPDLQSATKNNSFGIVEYAPQSYIPSDLDVFARDLAPKAVGFRPTLASINGGVDIPGPANMSLNGESNLDLQYAIALTYPLDVTLYQVGDPSRASFNTFLDAIDASYCSFERSDDLNQDIAYPYPEAYSRTHCSFERGDDLNQDIAYPYPEAYSRTHCSFERGDGLNQDIAYPYPEAYSHPGDCGKYKPANVISSSYGYNEADLTPFYETRQCNEYMKLGLVGTTVLYASGDYGVAGGGGECINPTTGGYSTGPDGIKFNPSFPSTCPYITSVGATQVNPGSTVSDPESACEQVIYSGGGFSNVFPIPSYQREAVAQYFKTYKPIYNATHYNNSMMTRGFPDISANGANYLVALGGSYYRVYGTVASTPVVGSIISLLNDALLASGKKPVGFLNPALYQNAWVLNDITSGGNQGCGTPGFTCVPGWDPVTGLGTLSFPRLLTLFLGQEQLHIDANTSPQFPS